MDDVVILYTTWPDLETAEVSGAGAVEARLAACANLLGPMTSIYRWDGAVRREAEVAMLFKTSRAGAGPLRDWLLARHPYEIPCILQLGVETAGSNPAFLRWIGEEIA